ncbi:hypothetical protein MNBD_IGNAVI01-2032 [hydrothermal vent metagenome]|uniref:Uncharacterized protein n=1 Tax=hydrothermal vent metagenome TaxID=652676 RepID=A0A3B1CLL5_9ZZZZ
MKIIYSLLVVLIIGNNLSAQDFSMRVKYSGRLNNEIYSEYSHISFEGLFGDWKYFRIGPTIGFIDVDFNGKGALYNHPETQTSIGFIGYFFPFGKRKFKYFNIQFGFKLLHLTNVFRIPINGMHYSYPVPEQPLYSNFHVTNNFSSDIILTLELMPNNKINYIFEISYNTRYFDFEYRKNNYEPDYSYEVHKESKALSTFLFGIGLQFIF